VSEEGTFVTVGETDCIKSIADSNGFFWETLWDHDQNADLKKRRGDPDVLMPGDEVYVPVKRVKTENGATEKKHRFKRKGVPSVARFVVRRKGQPRASVRYVLKVDGQIIEGTTDGRGLIEAAVPPTARTGVLQLEEDGLVEEYEVSLGGLNPVSDISGARQRLSNLGYKCVEDDPESFRSALRAFQGASDLEPSGELDDTTQKKLAEAHGC
jgi:hypothetical protein